MRFEADAIAPGWGRAAAMRGSKATSLPREASSGHRSRQIRDLRQAHRARERETADRARHLHAIDQGQPLLGFESHRLEPAPRRSALAGGLPSPSMEDLALPDQAERQVRERREVSGGSDRPLLGNDGKDVGREQRQERLDRRQADSGMSFCKRVRAEGDHRPDGFRRQRLPDAGRMAPDEIALQLGELRPSG